MTTPVVQGFSYASRHPSELTRKDKLVLYFFGEPMLLDPSIKTSVFRNRYFRGTVYFVICLFLSATYYGWQAYQQLLYRNGAYQWLCTPEEISQFDDNNLSCERQNSAVQNLYTIALCCEFSFSVISGVCIDTIGPLATACIGHIMFFLAWLLTFYSSKSFQMYVPGMILTGGCINMMAYPCLELEELFPKRGKLCLSIIIAAQMAASLVPATMNLVLKTFDGLQPLHVVWGYLIIFGLPCSILAMLSHPTKRLCLQKLNTQAEVSQDVELSSPTKGDSSQIDPATSLQELNLYMKTHWTSRLIKALLSQKFILFAIYYLPAILANSYYPTMVDSRFDSQVGNFQEWFYPTQAIWGIVFGLFIDYLGTFIMIEILTIMFVLAAFTALSSSIILQYISSIIFLVSNSYIYTIKFTYLTTYFCSDIFGTLVGVMGTCSGLFALINIALREVLNPTALISVFIGTQLVSMLLIFTLQYKLRNYSTTASDHHKIQAEKM